MDIKQKLTGVIRSKSCSIKPFKDAPESKRITLNIDYSDLTIDDLLTKAISHDVIAWQNGRGRKDYKKLADGQVVNIRASAPAAAPMPTAEELLIAEARQRGISVEQLLTEKLKALKK